jgi:hypothetical protein
MKSEMIGSGKGSLSGGSWQLADGFVNKGYEGKIGNLKFEI